MRGKVHGFRGDHARVGITPAHAGKRKSPPSSTRPSGDHPRACGEKVNVSKIDQFCKGSPPRMRGKERLFRLQRLQPGITPAHAGKSLKDKRFLNFSQDHPRACGEKQVCGTSSPSRAGSPPRMRGKAENFLNFCRFSRITPAHAGKRIKGARPLPVNRDHPRACGEKFPLAMLSPLVQGSPPRMRGKGTMRTTTTQRPRITPAHAGKSWNRPTWPRCCKDHPRACGEKPSILLYRADARGSPPRMRGKD